MRERGIAHAAVLACVAVALCTFTAGCSNDPYPPEGDKKLVYGVLGEDPHGLDPVQAGDTLSGGMVAQIYESLYEYHYLKRPYELVPCLAEALPQVSEDGLVYTIPVKRGVRFQDDACFPEGRGREVTAEDFVYSIKRLMDMGNEPRGSWLLQGKVVGLDEWHEESIATAEAKGKMDYDQPIDGVRAIDRYTLQLQLKEPFPQLVYALEMSYTAAVPREAVESYGEDFVNHPVGTGPFRLKEWRKRWRMIMERNPTYRDDYYPSEGEPGDREAGLLDAAGTRLPIVDEIYYTVIGEAQPQWILFKQGYRDGSGISKDHFQEAISPEKELTEEFTAKGVTLTKFPEMVVRYVAFNMIDPVVGTNKALRQAMAHAHDTEWRIRNFYNGRAIPAQGPIPPGMFGYRPELRNPYTEYDLEKARSKLVEAGYPGGVGRDGERLKIAYDIGGSDPADRQRALAFARDMGEIGIEVEVVTNTWAEFLKKTMERRLQVFSVGWILDYPDPENFLQLLYGPRKAPGPNRSNFDNADYNRLFDEMKAMPDSPQRQDIIDRMVAIAVEECPWIPSTHSVTFGLRHQWVKNSKPHAMTGGYVKYRDIDVELRRRLRREWNRPNYLSLLVVAGAVLFVGGILALLRRGAAAREV